MRSWPTRWSRGGRARRGAGAAVDPGAGGDAGGDEAAVGGERFRRVPGVRRAGPAAPRVGMVAARAAGATASPTAMRRGLRERLGPLAVSVEVRPGEGSKTMKQGREVRRAARRSRDDSRRSRRRARRRGRRRYGAASARTSTSAGCRWCRFRRRSSPRSIPPTAARPGWTWPREELRRRVPPAGRGARRHRDARDPAAEGAGGGFRRGDQDGSPGRWRALGAGPADRGDRPRRARRVVFACARYKCGVVAADERDGGLRHVLNLGHTVGHAIEAVGAYSRYRHGEAVGLGLLAALRLSEGRCSRGGRGDSASSRPAVSMDAAWMSRTCSTRFGATRSGPPPGSASSSSRSRASPAKGRSSIRVGSDPPWRSSIDRWPQRPQPRGGHARRQLRHPRAPRPGGLRGHLARRAGAPDRRLRLRSGLEATFFQTNSEGELVEYLHRAPEVADAVVINAGAWTHYSRAIADALDVARLPAVEVHLSDVESRDDWRRVSVFDGLVLRKVSGKGPEGYREALEALAAELGVG